MRTGLTYMGHHNPKHLETDIREMNDLRIDDILLAAQENDFAHFTGKLKFTAKIAADYGICPIAIFWVRPKGWHIFINLVFLSFQSLNEAIYNDIILRPEHINALFPGRTDQIQAS